MGISNKSKVLVVCHCYRENEEVIRIISARKADGLEISNMEYSKMREHYDFSNAVKNPYIGKLKQQITIRLDEQIIDYFKNMAEETGIPYQNIINYYLLDCVKEKKHLEVYFSK